MKKRTIRMIVTLFLLIVTAFASYTLGWMHGESFDPTSTYDSPARVAEVDEATGWVTFVDWSGEAWCIRGEGYEVGQLVIVDFNDNNTPDNIYDYLIVNVHRLVDIKDINE